MWSITLNWRVVSLTVGLSFVLLPQANARDLKPCLAIQDIDQRVECLEGRAEPPAEAPAPPRIVPKFSPSFDCNKATSGTEMLICSDTLLAQLDAKMGQAYSQALKDQNDSGTLINEQRRWLSMRDNKCGWAAPSTARSCVMEMTTARIAALAATAIVQSEQPGKKPSDEQASSETGPAPPATQAAITVNEPASSDSLRTVDELTASKVMIDSIQSLLGASRTESVKFFKYVVDKKELQGFKQDMPVLRIVYDERVFFDTDKDVLRSEAMPVVKSIAATLRQQKQKVALFVAGHTDARGTEQYNLDLSIRRAEGVARAIKQQGSGATLIWRVGFGKAIPIRPNTSDINMALNRRVEFLIASEANIITTWIKNTKGLCEDETCGTTSIASNFQATPIDSSGARPINIEIPTPKPVEIQMQFHPIEIGPPLQ